MTVILNLDIIKGIFFSGLNIVFILPYAHFCVLFWKKKKNVTLLHFILFYCNIMLPSKTKKKKNATSFTLSFIKGSKWVCKGSAVTKSVGYILCQKRKRYKTLIRYSTVRRSISAYKTTLSLLCLVENYQIFNESFLKQLGFLWVIFVRSIGNDGRSGSTRQYAYAQAHLGQVIVMLNKSLSPFSWQCFGASNSGCPYQYRTAS